MNVVNKTLAGLFAALFILSGALALLLFNLEREAFDAATYKQAFTVEKLYERVPGIAAEAITVNMSASSSASPLMKNLSASDWETIITSLLPSDELKAITNEAIDSVLAYFNNQADSATLPLVPFKQKLSGEAGLQAALQIIQAQPDCTLEQITKMTISFFSAGEISLCNPPAELLGMATPLIQTQLEAAVLAIPDQVTLIRETPQGSLNDPRQKLDMLRILMRLSPIVPLLCLLLVTALAVRSFRDWLNWWGIPLAITGGIGALTAWIGGPLIGAILQTLLAGRLPTSMPPVIFDTFESLTGAILKQMLDPILWQSLLLAGTGMILVLLGFLVRQGPARIRR